MRHFYTLALALAFAIAPAAQAQRAVSSVTTLGTISESSQQRQDPMLGRHFDPDAPQVILTTNEGGYVFGTNGYLDLAKAVWYRLPEGQASTTIWQVNVYMARSETAAIPDYDIKVWSAVSDGSGSYMPDAEVYSETFPTSELPVIPAGEEPLAVVEHVFSTPVAFDATATEDGVFFVGVDVTDPLYEFAVEDIAIASSEQLAEDSPYEWEQWSDGSWHSVAGAWGASWHMWIEAVVDVITAGEVAAPAAATGMTALFPNPARETVRVSFRSAEAAEARIAVYDLLGRSVITAYEGVAGAAEQTVAFSTAGLSAGSYIVRFESGRTVETERLVVVK